MSRKDLTRVLMERDNLSRKQARMLIREAKKDLNERLANNEVPFDICEEHFGLEPVYLHDVIEYNSHDD